jgi:hypothetical protein
MAIANLNIDYSKKMIVGKVNGGEPDETGNIVIDFPKITRGYTKSGIKSLEELQTEINNTNEFISGVITLIVDYDAFPKNTDIEIDMPVRLGSGQIQILFQGVNISGTFSIKFAGRCDVEIFIDNISARKYNIQGIPASITANLPVVVLNGCGSIEAVYELNDQLFYLYGVEVAITGGNYSKTTHNISTATVQLIGSSKIYIGVIPANWCKMANEHPLADGIIAFSDGNFSECWASSTFPTELSCWAIAGYSQLKAAKYFVGGRLLSTS